MAHYLSLGFGKDDFYNITVSMKVVECSENNSSSTPKSVKDEAVFNSWDFALSEFLEPWSSNLLGPFAQVPDQEDAAQSSKCNETLQKSYEFSVYPVVVIDWLLSLIIFIAFLPALYFVIKAIIRLIATYLRRRKSSTKQTSKVAPMAITETSVKTTAATENCNGGLVLDFDESTSVKLPPAVHTELLSDRKGCQLEKGDVGRFLSHTLDLLNTGLSRVLWKTSSAGSGSVVASPTLGRRWSSTLNSRTGSSTSLGIRRAVRSTTSLSSMGDEDNMSLDSWDEYEETLQSFGWRQSRVPRISRSRVGGQCLQQLMSFLDSNLSTDGGHWRASCMVTSYLLKLLEKELQRVPNASSTGIKFVNFVSIGSTKKGTKMGTPNEFDVLMVLQPTCSPLQEAMVGGKVENLAPGKTLLALADTGLGVSKRFVKEIRLQDVRKHCMMTRQTCFTAHGLLDSAMAEVASRSRQLSEKFPYRIQKIESKPTFSKVILDTKPIKNLGFDAEEVSLNIIPAVCIADGGLQRLPLYAVPDWDNRAATSSRSLSVPKRNNGINSEFLWSFSTTALEEAFLAAIEQRMRLAGVDSCHLQCIQVLKTILQRTECVDGEATSSCDVSGYWLETVVNFLLLESPSEMWSYDRLTNRISDAIIFFKRAIQNQRLPHFFIGNPHLLKQFPYLKMFPWLSGDRQVNLMSSLTEASSEKLLKHVDERIHLFPLKHALSRNYSSEMWEYEFFVFN